METLFINKTPTNNFISLSLSLSLTLDHHNPPSSWNTFNHHKIRPLAILVDFLKTLLTLVSPLYIFVHVCRRSSQRAVPNTIRYWVSCGFSGLMQVEQGNQIGFFFFFLQVECVVDIFELMRGEWKNQISVIRVVILGLGV